MRPIVLILLLFSTTAAQAYVGPGLGLGVIGAILGALLTVVLAIAGVVWYPIKRLLKKMSPPRPAEGKANPRTEEARDGEKSSEA